MISVIYPRMASCLCRAVGALTALFFARGACRSRENRRAAGATGDGLCHRSRRIAEDWVDRWVCLGVGAHGLRHLCSSKWKPVNSQPELEMGRSEKGEHSVEDFFEGE